MRGQNGTGQVLNGQPNYNFGAASLDLSYLRS